MTTIVDITRLKVNLLGIEGRIKKYDLSFIQM